MKHMAILASAALVIVLPFIFRRDPPIGAWRPGDPELIVITPHNEAIRQEFAEGFSAWHARTHGRPARIDWRVIGGTTEIMRYLASEYVASARRVLRARGLEWPANGAEAALASVPPEQAAGRAIWQAFRDSDEPGAITCGMDVFFGGGVFDHAKAERQGLTTPAWGASGPPVGLFTDAAGRELIPRAMNGEVWRGEAFYGNVLSAFGICYNVDRLADLGIATPPATWEDLTDPRYFGHLGLADPTKSGSVAKAFEMIVHVRCARAVAEAGFTRDCIHRHEAAIAAASLPPGELPESVPRAYQDAIERGWHDGIRLLRRIGANARYFTDSSSKVPVDVSSGAAAAGIAIDFMGRFQAEFSSPPGGGVRMGHVTPVGGSSLTADPISLLRGAPNRELAVRFIEYVLSEDGQRLWNYRPGTPGGPRRFALRRLPIRRDFYPSDDPEQQAVAQAHWPHLSDPLWEPESDAYHLAAAFLYEPRWTSRHFGFFRDLVRAMCLDAGDELRRAWRAILAAGGPEDNPEAMRLLEALPQQPLPLTWAHAKTGYTQIPRFDYLREWTAFFRRQYRMAEAAALRRLDAQQDQARAAWR